MQRISPLERTSLFRTSPLSFHISLGDLIHASLQEPPLLRSPHPESPIAESSGLNECDGKDSEAWADERLPFLWSLHGDLGSADVLVSALKRCAVKKDISNGRRIHADIAEKGLLKRHASIGNSLVNMYAKCNALSKAQEVFDELPYHSVVTWNALISGYSQHGLGREALEQFEWMKLRGLLPNAVTLVCALKACGSLRASMKGKQIHAQIVREGLLRTNIIVGNALVDMYGKCGIVAKAREVFEELSMRDVVSWTALISGYAQQGCGEEALKCIEQMQRSGFSPDVVTFVSILKACASIGAGGKGEEIHNQIIREGFVGENCALSNALMDMYSKCGFLEKARDVFQEVPVQDVVSWTTLVGGYVRQGCCEDAMKHYERMLIMGILADAIMLVHILKACSIMGSIIKGQHIHTQIVAERLLERNNIVGNALVDMYAKCGSLGKAQQVFDMLPIRDVVSWNALITGYSQIGNDKTVFNLFDKMIAERKEPNLVTFTGLLNACSHGGLLEKGQMYFESMRIRYQINPTLEHYTCIIDLFGRAGYIEKAFSMINEMPFSADLTLWLSMLGACQKWGNVSIASLAFEQAIRLDETDDAAYMCMINIYTSAGMYKDAKRIEALRVQNVVGRG